MFTRLLLGFFQRPTGEFPESIFTQNTSNDLVPRKDVIFRVDLTQTELSRPVNQIVTG